MNILDLGSIDRLVRRNSNLLTALKVIDEVESEDVVRNICENVGQFNTAEVTAHGRVLDIVTVEGCIPISYYFADRFSESELNLVYGRVRDFCQKSGIDYVNS